MIEHLMSSSLSGDHQGCAAGFIRLHVRGLRSDQSLIARVVGDPEREDMWLQIRQLEERIAYPCKSNGISPCRPLEAPPPKRPHPRATAAEHREGSANQ